MEIKPIKKALMPKFFAVAVAVTAAGTLTGCGTAGEVAQPTGLVSVEAEPTVATEMRLDGEAPIEAETDEIIERADDVDVSCEPSTVCETCTTEEERVPVRLAGTVRVENERREPCTTEETEPFTLAGDVSCEPGTNCETELETRLYAPGMFNLDDAPSIQHDTENAAEQNAMAADQGRRHAEAFQKAFAAYDITLVENTDYTFDSLQSVWSSTETPPRVVIYFYDGCGVHEGSTMEVHLRNAFSEAEGLRVMDWGLAYDNENTFTAYIDSSELFELNDEAAEKIAKELLK